MPGKQIGFCSFSSPKDIIPRSCFGTTRAISSSATTSIFQLPFQRNHNALHTLDLELDLVVNPDLSYKWKDLDDYQNAVEHNVIFPEWIQGIEAAKHEIFDKLEKRQYPFDGSWLDWQPDPGWSPPALPANWDKI